MGEHNRGFQLLKNLGWKVWTGLGKFQQGRLEPINPVEHMSPPICNSVMKTAVSCLPEITVCIGHMEISAMIDSGSEITCVSETFFKYLQRHFESLPTLPAKATQIIGAFNTRSRRIHKQVLLSGYIQGVSCEFCCLVIPGLTKQFIIGIDWLTEHKCVLSLETYTLTIKIGNQVISTPVTYVNTLQQEEIRETIAEEEFCQLNEILQRTSDKIALIRNKVNESELTGSEKQQLYALLVQFQDLFCEEPGLTHLYEHEMKMIDQDPVVKRSYPVPFSLRSAVEEKLKEMEERGIIERTTSQYSSPLVVIKKKDNTVRICLDARGINEKLISDTETPPKTEELLQKFHGCRFLSSIDLNSSFWQIPLSAGSRKYTAFSYNGRTYCFRVLPFGVKTAVASFSRCMDIVLGTDVREFTSNYIDDLLIASCNFPVHLQHISRVFRRLIAGGMTVNLAKSKFGRQEVPFLGHILTPLGIKMDEDKLRSIRKFPRPTKIKQLRAFLGLCNFYKRFCKQYSDHTAGLRHLLRKGNKWTWGDSEERCFENLKNQFINSVVLIHPDLRKEFFLDTDSSYFAIAAVLYQKDDQDEIGVIAFISRSLQGAELNYTTTEKELLAIVYALQRCRVYLLGNRVNIRTDHKALTFLKQCRFTNDRMTRWLLFLQQFDINIVHVKGTQNKIADLLSRYPPENASSGQKTNPVTIANLVIDGTADLIKDLKRLGTLQRQDNQLSRLLRIKQGLIEPSNHERRIINNYRLSQKVLLHVDYANRDTIAIPTCLQEKLIWHYHLELGHFGPAKVYHILRTYFYWKGMNKQIRKILATCDLCQRTKRRNRTYEGEMRPLIANEIGELIAVDYFGPLPTARGGYRYILVVLDVFSKYIKLFPLRRANTAITLKHLREGVMPHINVRQVLSDHGTQFTSRRWIDTLRSWNIRPNFISIRHPQSNPAERYMKTLGRFLRTYCHQLHKSWTDYLPDIEDCLNKTPHASTLFAPVHILTGRPPRYLLQDSIKIYLKRGQEFTRQEIHQQVRRNLRKHAQQRIRKQKRHHIWNFSIGEEVLLKVNKPSDAATGQMKKFNIIYDGPYYITAEPYPNVYEIRRQRNGPVVGHYNTYNLVPYRRA